jgi:hypothetical protein
MRALLALLLSSVPAWGQTCKIVTDSSLHVFQHELAHCNGWTHKPFEAGINPPEMWVHPYDGELVVYLTGVDYSGQMDTIGFAQVEAEFIMSDKTPPQLCSEFWKDRGVMPNAALVSRIVGCSVK